MGVLDDLVSTRRRRMSDVDRRGSPYFRHSFGVIAAITGREAVGIRRVFRAAAKYEPLDTVEITNNSGANLILEINGERIVDIPAGVIKGISDQSIWDMTLVNLSAVSTVAGEVTAVFQRQAMTADRKAQRSA